MCGAQRKKYHFASRQNGISSDLIIYFFANTAEVEVDKENNNNNGVVVVGDG